jgi:hypothetical protein
MVLRHIAFPGGSETGNRFSSEAPQSRPRDSATATSARPVGVGVSTRPRFPNWLRRFRSALVEEAEVFLSRSAACLRSPQGEVLQLTRQPCRRGARRRLHALREGAKESTPLENQIPCRRTFGSQFSALSRQRRWLGRTIPSSVQLQAGQAVFAQKLRLRTGQGPVETRRP